MRRIIALAAAASHRFWRARRGTAAMEFAFVAPVMIMAVAGSVELGAAFKVYHGVNRVATQYASAWSDCTDSPVGTCATELLTFSSSSTVSNVAPQLVPARITLQMFQVTMVGTNPVVTYQYPAAGSLTTAQTNAARATIRNGQVGVVVTLTYQHGLAFFSRLMDPILSPYLQQSFTVVQLKS